MNLLHSIYHKTYVLVKRALDIITDIVYNYSMYSTKEAANKLGLSQDHVRLLARRGFIKAKKLGHDWVVLDLKYTRKRKPKEAQHERSHSQEG